MTKSARKIARVVINVIGIAAGLGGAYFLFETGSVIWDVVSMSSGRSHQPSGPAGLAIMMVGLMMFFMIFVFGVLTAILLAISAWALEPRRRWREWRAKSKSDLRTGGDVLNMSLRERIKSDLPTAMRARETIEVATLRSVLAAIDNAGAVPPGPAWPPVVGRSADVPRRPLSDADVRKLIHAEADERRTAIPEYERLGKSSDAKRLREELSVLSRYL